MWDAESKYCALNRPSAQPEPEEFEWCTGCKEYDQEAHCCHRWTKVIRNTVKEIKNAQSEPKWIPCSERLPERGVSVLISHVGYVSEDYLDIDELEGAEYFWINGINLNEELKNLAWMPLPTPWEGGVE